MITNEIYPVLIISYARPEGVRSLIESCIANNVTDIYVAIDGPKSEGLKSRQDEIVKVINSFAHISGLTLRLLKREQNVGVGVGVISAIDWFFDHEECGHILEDDLKVSDGFFKFSRFCLSAFSKSPNVYMISGTEISGMRVAPPSTLWSNYPMIWGWSTWRERWKVMRECLLEKKSIAFPACLSAKNNYWAVGANRVLDGLVDTWDTPLAAEFIRRDWLCAIPPVNLVSNFGDDGSASHTTSGSLGLNLPINEFPTDFEFNFGAQDSNTKNYNLYLEKNIFKIRKRHVFLPIYSYFFDRFTFGVFRLPLNQRLTRS